uniref:Uncharacterized protein n=1 Tax=Anguilla anguilla TaxID=7936 RepID=A0A0E9W6H4_ANGAN
MMSCLSVTLLNFNGNPGAFIGLAGKMYRSQQQLANWVDTEELFADTRSLQ